MVSKNQIALLFTFLGGTGGIPVIEKNFLKSVESEGMPQQFTLIGDIDYAYSGQKFVIGKNRFLALFQVLFFLKKNNIHTVFYEFHVFPLFVYRIFCIQYYIKIYDLFFYSRRYSLVFLLTIINSLFAKKILTSSYATKSLLEELYSKYGLGFLNKKIVVVYGSYNEKFVASLSLEYPTFLEKNKLKDKEFLSIISSENPEFLMKGFLEVNKKYNNKFKLVIVGNYPEYQDKILGENIYYLGYVSREDLIASYKYSKAILYQNKNEGFGYIPLESLLSGTPIITNKDLAIGEILSEFGNFYTSYEDYLAKLVELYEGIITDIDISKRDIYVEKNFNPTANFYKEITLITNS